MKVLMIILCIAFITSAIFLISKYGIKRSDGRDYAGIENNNEERS